MYKWIIACLIKLLQISEKRNLMSVQNKVTWRGRILRLTFQVYFNWFSAVSNIISHWL